MLTSNENGKNQWKSSTSINPDFLDKQDIPTSINLTNRFERLYITEENSGPVDKNNDVTPKNTIENDNLNHVIIYDIHRNNNIDPLFVRN